MLEARQEVAPSTAVVIERGGIFFVYEPSLGIVVSDETIEGAYRRFAGAKRALVDEAERAGLTIRRFVAPAEPQLQPQLAGGQRPVVAELTIFFAKICIVFLVIGGLIALGAGFVKPLAMGDIADKAADIARDISSLSPDKKDLLRQSVGGNVREWVQSATLGATRRQNDRIVGVAPRRWGGADAGIDWPVAVFVVGRRSLFAGCPDRLQHPC